MLYPLFWRAVESSGLRQSRRGNLDAAQAELTSRAGTPAGIAWLTDTGLGLRPHPLLVQIADTSPPPVAWATPEEFWSYLATVLPYDELRRLGEVGTSTRSSP